jgi:hypothetical protein
MKEHWLTVNKRSAARLARIGLLLALLLSLLLGSLTVIADDPAGDGVRSPGYWSQHPEVWWELGTIPICDWNDNGVCDEGEQCIEYTVEDALKILRASEAVQGMDKRFTLGRALIAAWLNIVVGNNEYYCIEKQIGGACNWMLMYGAEGNPLEGGRRVPGGWRWTLLGEPLYLALDDYNTTGGVCAVPAD